MTQSSTPFSFFAGSEKTTTTQTPISVIRAWAEGVTKSLPSLSAPLSTKAFNTTRGIHGKRRAGSGDSFWQFRPFQEGDQQQDIDWRQSAKSDHLFVRQQEWESAQNVWIWCDTSPTMDYRSKHTLKTKLETSLTLSLATAMAYSEGGEKIGLLGVDEQTSLGQFGLERFTNSLDHERERANILPQKLPKTRQAHFVIFSDFLKDKEELDHFFETVASLELTGHLIQILDPVEMDFPFKGRVKFQDITSDDSFLAGRANDLKANYDDALKDWQSYLTTKATAIGWHFNTQRTDVPLSQALLDILATSAEYAAMGGQ